MKRNLKLLSGILMASFLSNSTLNNSIYDAKAARTSRPVVVNNTSSDKNSSSSSSNETTNEEDLSTTEAEDTLTNDTNDTDSKDESSTSDSSTSEDMSSETTNILTMLNSNPDITVEEIAQLALSVSNSKDFLDEFAETFPDILPLRKVSPVDVGNTNYIDVTNIELLPIDTHLEKNSALPSVYAEQNICNGLLKEIATVLNDLNKTIKEEYPSTIFSLMPTPIIFNDTFATLSLKYNSIMESNYDNHTTLDILLDEIKPQISTLLKGLYKFKTQLPDLIDALNKLAEDNSNSSTEEDTTTEGDSSNNTDSNNASSNNTDSNNASSNNTSSNNTSSNNASSNNANSNNTSSNNASSNNASSNNASSNNTNSNNASSETTEEEVDPTKVLLYFGEDGQEIILDEETGKYYEINPEDPNEEELIEYTGKVTTTTLADYLATELYFDSEGNELYYDSETDSLLSYLPDTDEFIPYEGEVTVMTMEEYLDQLEQQQ